MNRTEFNAFKFAQIGVILCDARCAPSVKIVAAHVYTKYLSADHGYAWVSRATLTRELGYNDSTVSHAYDRLEELGYVAIERHKGRGKTNKLHPLFMGAVNVAVPQRNDATDNVATPQRNDSIKRCEPHAKTLPATSENVATPQHDSITNPLITTNEGRASLASPPVGGSRSAPYDKMPSVGEKDFLQDDGERLDDGAQRATAEEVREIVKRLRAPSETPEAGEEGKRLAASKRLSRADRSAFWMGEIAAAESAMEHGKVDQ